MVAPLRVGLAGSAVARMLVESREQLAERAGRPIDVVAFAAKDPPRDQKVDVSKLKKFDNPSALAADSGIDVFVELLGGEGGPAKSSVEAALGAGRAVVTANKALIARHGNALAKLAEKSGASFAFEAAERFIEDHQPCARPAKPASESHTLSLSARHERSALAERRL